MEKLFGMPIESVMIGLLIIFGLVVAVVAIVALRNHVFFRAAARNIPRRRTQSVLIVVGAIGGYALFLKLPWTRWLGVDAGRET